jgi:methionyl-tRNA synthetase
LQISAALSVLFTPVLPGKMAKLREQLGVPGAANWQQVNDQMLASGQIIKKGDILFEKIEDEVVQAQVEKLKKREAESQPALKKFPPLKDEAEFGNFASLDLRAGKIIGAKKVKKSKKLLQISVDIGIEKRTILSGIAEFYKPDEIIGTSVCVVANLAPKKMMGIESNGMILMGEDSEGTLHFVETDAEPGSLVT